MIRHCPACHSNRFDKSSLADGPRAHQCADCAGVFVERPDYEAWLAGLAAPVPESAVPVDAPARDGGGARVCPCCGRLMLKYRVGRGAAFSIDGCGGCGSVWLDAGEWRAVRAAGLQDNLHQILSAPWQESLRVDDYRRTMEAAYARRFGDADFARARELNAWLAKHPERVALLAFLGDPSPLAPKPR